MIFSFETLVHVILERMLLFSRLFVMLRFLVINILELSGMMLNHLVRAGMLNGLWRNVPILIGIPPVDVIRPDFFERDSKLF
jgi:hypothetical protein